MASLICPWCCLGRHWLHAAYSIGAQRRFRTFSSPASALSCRSVGPARRSCAVMGFPLRRWSALYACLQVNRQAPRARRGNARRKPHMLDVFSRQPAARVPISIVVAPLSPRRSGIRRHNHIRLKYSRRELQTISAAIYTYTQVPGDESAMRLLTSSASMVALVGF